MSRSQGGLTIGQLAKAAGVHVQTVRYYERRRLLAASSRLPSGYRLYGEEELKRLRFIKNAQALGFTLREIEGLLNLRIESATRCREVQERASAKLATVEAKMRDLRALARALRTLIQACREGQPTDHCPILTSLENGREMAGQAPRDGVRSHGERGDPQGRRRQR